MSGRDDWEVADRDILEEKESPLPIEVIARHIASHLQGLTFLTTRLLSIRDHDDSDNVSQGSSADTGSNSPRNGGRSVDEESWQAGIWDDGLGVEDMDIDYETPPDVDESGHPVEWDDIFLHKDLPAQQEDPILHYLQQKQQGRRESASSSLSNSSILAMPGTPTNPDRLAPNFRSRVAFDTMRLNYYTYNTGITLSVMHDNFRVRGSSKTFMVGINEKRRSEEALEWVLTSIVNDYDTVVCVRVIEEDVRPEGDILHRERARRLLQWIIKKNKLDKAISVVLEYQFGWLGPTLDTMVRRDTTQHVATTVLTIMQATIHQPSIFIVGRKERSSQGRQGIWDARHSFSKYFLEKSSVPIVVVQPEDVRGRNKDEHPRDPSRNSYAQMLYATNGVHESDLIDDMLLLMEAKVLRPGDSSPEDTGGFDSDANVSQN